MLLHNFSYAIRHTRTSADISISVILEDDGVEHVLLVLKNVLHVDFLVWLKIRIFEFYVFPREGLKNACVDTFGIEVHDLVLVDVILVAVSAPEDESSLPKFAFLLVFHAVGSLF